MWSGVDWGCRVKETFRRDSPKSWEETSERLSGSKMWWSWRWSSILLSPLISMATLDLVDYSYKNTLCAEKSDFPLVNLAKEWDINAWQDKKSPRMLNDLKKFYTLLSWYRVSNLRLISEIVKAFEIYFDLLMFVTSNMFSSYIRLKYFAYQPDQARYSLLLRLANLSESYARFLKLRGLFCRYEFLSL